MWGYQALCVQDSRHSTQRENMHAKQVMKTRFCFNYVTSYSGTDTQGSQELSPNFSFRLFNMVQIQNDCTCITKKNHLLSLADQTSQLVVY